MTSSVAASLLPEPQLALPDKWDGVSGKCDVFITFLNLIYELQLSRYANDRQRIALMVSLLSVKAAEWATTVLHADSDIAHSYPEFV